MSSFAGHLTQTVGRPEPLALQEVVPVRPSITIHSVHLPDDGARVLFTEGMSALPMTVPEDGEDFQLAELALWLRDDWPLDEKSLDQPKFFWPIEWLRRVALYPHKNRTWLGGPYAILANDEPPQPLGVGTDLSCLLLLASYHPYGEWQRDDGSSVIVYDVLPLYSEERDLEKREGLPALIGKLREYAISPCMHPGRVNTALLD